jgi:hypothetical protein
MIRDGRLARCIIPVSMFLAIFLTALSTKAQQPSAAPAQQQSPTQQQPNAQPPARQQQPAPTESENKIKAHEEATGTSNDRLFYTLPNFLTIDNASQAPPLSAGEKFKIVARGSFDYVEYPWYGFLAAVSQAANSEPGYGQGWAGYGKRYGAAFGDGTIENFWTGAILPSILRQDPRFYQSGQGGFWHRTGYAVSRIFITRTDSGGETFNVSEVFGAAISAGISTYTYHPRSDRNLGNAASVWGSSVGYDTITLVVKEFWPDIRRKLRKERTESATQPAPPAHP